MGWVGKLGEGFKREDHSWSHCVRSESKVDHICSSPECGKICVRWSRAPWRRVVKFGSGTVSAGSGVFVFVSGVGAG